MNHSNILVLSAYTLVTSLHAVIYFDDVSDWAATQWARGI